MKAARGQARVNGGPIPPGGEPDQPRQRAQRRGRQDSGQRSHELMGGLSATVLHKNGTRTGRSVSLGWSELTTERQRVVGRRGLRDVCAIAA